MIRQVHDGLFVRRRRIIDLQLIFVRQRVNHRHGQIPWISLFAVLTHIFHLNRCLAALRDILRLPHRLVETFDPAMQAVVSVVLRQRVFSPINAEFPVRNSVSISANQNSQVVLVQFISGQVVVTQRHVGHLPGLVRHHDRDHRRAEIRNAHLHSILVLQRIKLRGLPVRSRPKHFLFHRFRHFRRFFGQHRHRQTCRQSDAHHSCFHELPPHFDARKNSLISPDLSSRLFPCPRHQPFRPPVPRGTSAASRSIPPAGTRLASRSSTCASRWQTPSSFLSRRESAPGNAPALPQFPGAVCWRRTTTRSLPTNP